ncbi:MAG: PLAT/LH2 domain-containing protein [bacterium]
MQKLVCSFLFILFVLFLQPINSQTTYSVEVRTASQAETGSNANGTDANVYITINGTEGSTAALQLDKGNYNDFEAGKTDTYSVTGDDVGTITSINISQDNSGNKPGWALEYIKVKKGTTTYVFPCYRWIAADEDDGQTSRELTPNSSEVYHIRISTCNKDRAGTDANVRIKIIGNDWSSYNRKLDAAGDDFERGAVKTYDLTYRDLGASANSMACYIGHDNAGKNADWCLCEIMITAKVDGVNHLWRWTGELWLKSGMLWSPTLVLNKEY